MTMPISTLPARRILSCYRASDEATRIAGAAWYDDALAICQRMADQYGVDTTHAVVALAHLSPRLPWAKNVEALGHVLTPVDRPAWVLTKTWDRAVASLLAPDPMETFGKTASKTRSFANAILGDKDAVTLDVWAARVVGIKPESLGWPPNYEALAGAFRRAAKRVNVHARDLQAITWVQVRGRAA